MAVRQLTVPLTFEPDVEQDLVAMQGYIAAYARRHKRQAGAPTSLLQLLLADLEHHLRLGRQTAPVPRTREYLLGELRGRSGDQIEETNFFKACQRLRERLQEVNVCESPHGVAVPNHKVLVRMAGPLVESVGPVPDEVWLELVVVAAPRMRKVTSVPLINYLPPLPIAFEGREKFLEPLVSRARSRMRSGLGFSGLPGVGKTGVAVALAQSYAQREGGVAAFVDVCGRSTDPLTTEQVYRALLSQLGGRAETPAHMLRSSLFYELNAQSGVVVFDDAGDAGFLRDLPVPLGWLFIVTSRQATEVDGIRWFRVPTLDLADARRLLVALGWKHGSIMSESRPGDVDLLYAWQQQIRGDRYASDEDVPLDAYAALAYACDGMPALLRGAATTLASHYGLSVLDYLRRWTAAPPHVMNLSSVDVLSRFASALDAVVATLEPFVATLYRKLSLLRGPITTAAVTEIFGGPSTTSTTGLDVLTGCGLLTWNADRREYRYPPLVLAHASAALRQHQIERSESEWQITRFMADVIAMLRDPATRGEKRNEITGWLRLYAADVGNSLRLVSQSLNERADEEIGRLLDVLTDAFVPSTVCPSTLIHDAGVWLSDFLSSMDVYHYDFHEPVVTSISAKARYLRGVAGRDWRQLHEASEMASDLELRQACYEALARTVAGDHRVPLRRLAEIRATLAETADIDFTIDSRNPALQTSIDAMKVLLAVGDIRRVDRMATYLRSKMRKPAPMSARLEFNEISALLAMSAAVRRDWAAVRLHARRAARHGRDRNLIAALQALGAAGQGNSREARSHVVTLREQGRPKTPAAVLSYLITGAALLLLGSDDTPEVLTVVVNADSDLRHEDRVVESYQALGLMLRAQWHANTGDTAKAQDDRERAVSSFAAQESRFRHLARALGTKRRIVEH